MSKDTHICMNHDESWIFTSGKDYPVCPKCKKSEWVFGYSGTKKPQRENGKK